MVKDYDVKYEYSIPSLSLSIWVDLKCLFLIFLILFPYLYNILKEMPVIMLNQDDSDMNVLYTFSGDPFNFIPSIFSVIDTHPHKNLSFYIIAATESELESNKRMLEKIKIPGVKFHFGTSPEHYYANQLQLSRWNAFLRLRFPLEYYYLDRVLYLDADTIVNGDLTSFYNQDFKGNGIIVVPDRFPDYESQYKNYFNSGVLVYNIKKFNEIDAFNKMLEFFKNNPKSKARDQSALNYVFHDIKIVENIKYNYFQGAGQETAKIIHMYNVGKPKIDNPRKHLYGDRKWFCYWKLYNSNKIPWSTDRNIFVCSNV